MKKPTLLSLAETILVVTLLTVTHTGLAQTEITEQGFLVEHTVVIEASASSVYDALVNVSAWWQPDHTYTMDATNLSLEATPGGCFCEQLPGGGGVEHLRVVYAESGKMLRLQGGLGPLQGHGVNGSLTWLITPTETTVELSAIYSVGGFMAGGFEVMAPAVDGVINEQIHRL